MKLFLATLFIGFATAAQLQNTYLPPGSAASAGGHGNFLQGPNSGGTSGNYLAPKTTFNNAGQPNAFSHGAQSGFGSLSGGAFGAQGGHSQQSATYSGAGGFGGGRQGPSGPQIPILSYNNINNGDGSYHFDYATGNGIQQNEDGHLNNPGSEYAEQVVQGSYSYTGDDGQTYTVHYKADGNGFQASGDHLPTPPPIPEAIQRSLEYNAAHPEENNAGAYNSAAGQSGSYGGAQGSFAAGSQGGFSAGAGRPGGSFSGASTSHGGSFGRRPQQQYLPPQQHQSGGPGGAAGYHY